MNNSILVVELGILDYEKERKKERKSERRKERKRHGSVLGLEENAFVFATIVFIPFSPRILRELALHHEKTERESSTIIQSPPKNPKKSPSEIFKDPSASKSPGFPSQSSGHASRARNVRCPTAQTSDP